MRTVTYQSVLNGIAMSLGLDPNRDLNSTQAAKLTEYLNQRLPEGWRWDFWPEWTVVEQRVYREAYDATRNVVATDERYFTAAQNYYQALRAQTPAAQAPATLTGTVYVENSAWWAVSAQSYSGNDWATGATYSVGTQVRDPSSGRFYQCYTAHTSGASFDLTKFGILTPFDPYVGYDQTQAGVALTPIDEVKGVYRRNPRVFPKNPGAVPWQPSNNGIQVTRGGVSSTSPSTPALVWVEFRLRPPVFTSTGYVASKIYAAGDLVYYSTNAGGTGECYLALQAGTGNLPTVSAFWSKVNFPMVLGSWVKRAAFADGLKDQKQTDRAVEELEEAKEELAEACDRALQGQFERVGVATYGA